MNRVVFLFAALLAGSANAQDLGPFKIEAGISTLGFFVSSHVRVSEEVGFRAPLYFGGYSDEFEDDDGNTLDGKLTTTSVHLMTDVYWRQTGFRLSGGLAFGGYRIEADITNPEIDGFTYNGKFDVDVEQKRNVAPVLSVGYQRELRNNFGISAEIGARFTGLEVTTKGQENLSPALRAQFNNDIDDINDDLADIKALPFVSLAATFRF